MIITTAYPGYVLIGREPPHPETRTMENWNHSMCMNVKPFDLTQNVYLTVCKQPRYTLIDIRKFVNGTTTILSIHLNGTL